MSKSYLLCFKPVGLLAAGGWPGVAQNDYDQFWHERFCVAVPAELVEYLFPCLPALEKVCTMHACLFHYSVLKHSLPGL